MRGNPEFVRNLWLEMTPHRLVAVPGVIALLTALATAASAEGYGEDVGVWAAVGAGALLGFWGSRLAAGAVADEAANRTWDLQRLSALTPWQMTWGKLAGSTAVAWYGGALCLLVFVTASAAELPPRRLAILAGFLVAGVVLCQAVALLAALLELRRGGESARRSRGAAAAGLAFVLYWSGGSAIFSRSAARETVGWYGGEVTADAFWVVSVAAFAVWAVVGAWRVMREELQTRGAPWAWLGFAAFFMWWVAGTAVGTPDALDGPLGKGVDPVTTRLVAAFLASLALLYFTLILDPKDPVSLRRLVAGGRPRPGGAGFEALPPWMATVPLVLLAGAAAAAAGTRADTEHAPAAFVASCVGFAARDLGLLLAFNLGPNRKRADATAMFYWVLAYGVVPGLLGQLGGDLAWHLFFPTARGPVSVIAPATQAAAVALLLRARWRAARSLP